MHSGLDEGSRVTREYGEENTFSDRIEQIVFDFAPTRMMQ